MTLKIYLDSSIGNSVKKLEKIQNLFGGDSARKPNFFGYFLRIGIDPENKKVFCFTNRYDSKKKFKSDLNSKLLTLTKN